MKVLNRKTAGIPASALYVGRGTKWGNPFVIGKDGDREAVVAKYRRHLWASKELIDALPELYGKDLVCSCSPKACHADVLLRATDWHWMNRRKAA